MQAGKFKPQILATRRLGNSNPKSLLHAGWEMQTPNPCYMQVGKFKPQILATCRLSVKNPQILATRRLGNQTPPPPPPSKALLHGGREIKSPQILAMCRLGDQKPQILVTDRLGNQTPNLCYMQAGKFKTPNHAGWEIKNQNPCYTQVGNSDNPPPDPSKSLLHVSWELKP